MVLVGEEHPVADGVHYVDVSKRGERDEGSTEGWL
jgi:hypothetical protein